MRSQLIASNISPVRLLDQLAVNSQLWGQHDARKKMGQDRPHNGMTDIWVRYNDFARFDAANPGAFNNEHVPIWYPAWRELTALKPVVNMLMNWVDGEMLGGILITKIPAGGGILPHVDTGWHVNYFSKFYWSLKSAPGAVFSFQDAGASDSTREDVRPSPGDIYYIDNRKRHWVENNSNEDRITVIICIRTEKFGG